MATTDRPLTHLEELALAPAVDFVDAANSGTDHSGPWTILQVMFGNERVRLGAVGRVGEPEIVAPVSMLRAASRERFLRAVYGDKPICPRCSSPDPAKHPAVQLGGEVQLCPDPFHLSTELGRAMFKIAGGAICSTCNDTHVMSLGDSQVMCTSCPAPCQECRAGGTGPFCAQTPCSCACHTKKASWSKQEQERVVAAEHDALKCGFPDIDCEICYPAAQKKADEARAEEAARARAAQREWAARLLGSAVELTGKMQEQENLHNVSKRADPIVLAATIIADAIDRAAVQIVRVLDAIDRSIDLAGWRR